MVSSLEEETMSKYFDEKYNIWIDSFINRHIKPWQKYLYLQIHLASPVAIKEYVFRAIGSSITRNDQEQATPGYEVEYPSDTHEANEWANNLDGLEFIRTKNKGRLSRLRELASIDEAHAVFRLPYPPESGFPNTEFLTIQDEH